MSTTYPEYGSEKVEVKIVRFLADMDLEEDVEIDVYPEEKYDEDALRNAIWNQHGYKKGDFDLVNN